MSKICLIGANGNLGKVLNSHLISNKYVVESITRDDNVINKLNTQNYDLIINAANKYFVRPNKLEYQEMEDAILRVAQSIVESKINAPLIFFSSYMQYLPSEYQPWSEYTVLKNRSVKLYRNFAEKKQIKIVEIVLYDNYGGHNKNKFFDLVLKSASTGVPLQATLGESVLNLTNINDISRSLISFIKNIDLFSKESFSTYSIYSANTFTLKELVSRINHTLKINVPVVWNALPYREKEVFQFYNNKPLLPTFFQTLDIDEYILSQVNDLKL
jgi:nucleoside-diphosphate-sugar epimerase